MSGPTTAAPIEKRWIWPFELTERIGEGGMGVVYRARYVVNNQHVAVKMIPDDITDEVIISRFERELEILKNLRHPNIVRCFGGVCEDKRRFYAMELVEGGTLDRLLKERGRFPWGKVVEYGKQIASALEYSHKQGVIHRDIKPGNFLLTETGQLKLSDFGIATMFAARRITSAGRTMGSYHYMAPEQIRGEEVTPRTDLYALGCVLFELLTGKPPFLGFTPAEILQKHLKVPPPEVRQTVFDCPDVLNKLVSDLLKKDPTERPQSATEVLASLKAASTPAAVISQTRRASVQPRVSHRPTGALKPAPEPPPVPKKKLSPAAIAILFLLSLLAGSLITNYSLWQRSKSLARIESTLISAATITDLTQRAQAIKSLGTLAQTSPRALDEIVRFINDSDPTTKAAACEALGSAGLAARKHYPTLQSLVQNDESEQVRIAATAAIEKIRTAQPTGSSWPYFVIPLGLAAIGWFTLRLIRTSTADGPEVDDLTRSRPAIQSAN